MLLKPAISCIISYINFSEKGYVMKDILRKTGLHISDRMERHEVMKRLLFDNLSFCLPMGVLTAGTGIVCFFLSIPAGSNMHWIRTYLVLAVGSLLVIFTSLYYRKHQKARALPGWIAFFIYFFSCSYYGMARALFTYSSKNNSILAFVIMVVWCFGIFELYPLASIIYGAIEFYGMYYLMDMVGIHNYDLTNWTLFYFVIIVLSIIRYTLSIRNIYNAMEIEVRNDQLEYLSCRDGLTGLYNRFYLREKFASYLNHELIVAMMDIDDFKHYNDDFGHAYGDYILKLYARTAQHSFGNSDVYRYGGDEILIVSRQSRKTFEKEIKAFGSDLKLGFAQNSTVTPTFSLGYVLGSASDNNGLRLLLKQADENLYDIKHSAKNAFKGSTYKKDA